MSSYNEFIKNSEIIPLLKKENKSLYHNFEKGKKQFSDIEQAREMVSDIKSHTIENLDFYLNQFEENFTKNGGKILWADSQQDAIKEINKILKIFEIKQLAKSKSTILDEIELSQNIDNKELKLIETFVELNNENSDSNQIKQQILKSDAGISGVNFLISDIGGIALTENEGNILLSSTATKIQIYVSTIKKIIPSISDFGHFASILSSFSSGQKISAFNSIITSPRKIGDLDGPERIYLVLINNNRTDLLNTQEQYNALKCIQCGSCSSHCSVFKTIGKEMYNSSHSEPIASVILPHIKTKKQYGHLSFACTLCGICYQTCPVKIKLDRAIIQNRIEFSEEKILPKKEKLKIDFNNFFVAKRDRIDALGGFYKNVLLSLFAKNRFGKHKTNPRFYKHSFSYLFKNNKRFY